LGFGPNLSWELGLGKNLGWELGFGTPLHDPLVGISPPYLSIATLPKGKKELQV